jgi:hypothetical protein
MVMPIFNLLDVPNPTTVTTVGTAATGCGRFASNNEGLIQSEVAGAAADIKLEGRMTDGSSWTTIDTTTYSAGTDGSIRVALFPQMRATLVYSSGTVTKGLVNLYTT